MKRFLVAVALGAAGFCSFAQAPRANLKSDCETNFSVSGSFFTGKTFSTWREHPSTSYDVAFRKVGQAVALIGMGSVNLNKEAGIISASQSVTMGQGATAPLNVVVVQRGSGVRVEANFSIGAGQMTSEDVARTQLCKLADAPGN